MGRTPGPEEPAWACSVRLPAGIALSPGHVQTRQGRSPSLSGQVAATEVLLLTTAQCPQPARVALGFWQADPILPSALSRSRTASLPSLTWGKEVNPPPSRGWPEVGESRPTRALRVLQRASGLQHSGAGPPVAQGSPATSIPAAPQEGNFSQCLPAPLGSQGS